MKKQIYPIALALLLIAAIVAGRLVPHLPNFTPVAAIAIFAGFLFRSRALALLVPIVGMFISDLLFAGVYNYTTMAVVWAALALPALLGPWLRKPLSMADEAPRWKVALARISKLFAVGGTASVLFFVLSNLAVWLFDGTYALNAGGLTACFAAAVPFFKYTLAGDLVYVFSIFGAYSLVRAWIPAASLRFRTA